MKLTIKTKTENAFKGISKHYKETNTIKNKIALKLLGVKQELTKDSLIIYFDSFVDKLTDKMKKDGGAKANEFKASLENERTKDFIERLNAFMKKQKVKKEEYEVIF